MEVNIQILDVGDADAILVHLKKASNELVFVIDGGRDYHWKCVEPELTAMLNRAGKSAPDFVICTHYDDDHIGGLTKIIEKYLTLIPKVWVFRTSERFDAEEVKTLIQDNFEDEHIYPKDSDTALGGEIGYNEPYEISLRNLEQEIKFNKLLRDLKIPIAEPIAGDFLIEGWPELQILGPTKEYYSQLFPDKITIKEILEESITILKTESTEEVLTATQKSPSAHLDELQRSKITPTNMNSAILMLTTEDKKFLFAADAGIDSFLHIPAYQHQIANLHWLKVPHHGSKNNINSSLISLMRPKHAVVSGKRHISDAVLNCFKEYNCNLHCTRDSGNYSYSVK